MRTTKIFECQSCQRSKPYYCKGMCKSCYKKQLVPARWSHKSDACSRCGTTNLPHKAQELCSKCYNTQETAMLCSCGCGLTVQRIGNKIRRYRKGHWMRGNPYFMEAHVKGITGEKNPQFGKFGKNHPAYGHETTQETRELRRKTILRTLSEGKMGKTDIEVILSGILDEMGIKHAPQTLLYEKFTVDEYLPNERIVIEALGEYWHGDKRKYERLNGFQMANSKRDASKGAWLTKRGHRVVMLWERELKKNREWCKNEIRLAIENQFFPELQDSV